jgi:hypothetical protein
MRPDRSRHDDGVVTTASAAESPVQVTVLGPARGENLSLGGDDLELEGLIGGETVGGAESGVAATLGEASGDGNGGTFTGDDNEVLCCGGLDSLSADDTGGDLESWSAVECVGVVDDLSVLEVPEPDTKTTCTA